MSGLGKRFASGDEDAFNEVIERYSRKVYGLCYRILRSEEEARDMAQDVFVRVYTRRKSFRGRSSLFTWIYRITLNMCFTHLKKRKPRMIPLDDVEGALSTRQDDSISSGHLERLVAGSAENLPPKQKAVFIMRFYEKMTFREISQSTGTSIGTAKANYHFAVKRLREILGKVGEK